MQEVYYRKKHHIAVREDLKKHTKYVIQPIITENPLLSEVSKSLKQYDTLSDALMCSVSKLIYQEITKDSISLIGIEGNIYKYPTLRFKINDNFNVEITKRV